MKRIGRSVWLLAVYLAACDGAGDPRSYAAPATGRDSAGIAIVQLRGEEEAPVVSINAPSVAIGANDEIGQNSLFFHLVEGARRLSDGRIIVANRGTNEIIVIDSLGRRLGTMGREGGGPGEFGRLVSVLISADDTVVALDGQLRRVSLFGPNGKTVRDVVIKPPDGVSVAGLSGAVGFVGPGRMLAWVQASVAREQLERLNEPNTTGQVPRILFTVDSAGRTVSLIGSFPGPEVYLGGMVTPSGEKVAANWGPAPFGRWTGFGVHDSRVLVFLGAEGQFSVYAPDGRLLSIYQGGWSIRPVSHQDRIRSMDEWAGRYPSGPIANARRKELELVDYPERMPAYRDAVVGSDGIVWIEPYEFWDGEQRHYIGYDSTGLAIGKLALDYKDRIMEIGNGTILLLNVAEYGVETIRMAHYRF